MANKSEVKKVGEALELVLEYDAGTLGTDSGLGDINFEDSKGLFEEVLKLAKEINSLPLGVLQHKE